MVIDRNIICPYCAHEYRYLGFTGYSKCSECGIHYHIDSDPVCIKLFKYRGEITPHKVETISSRTKKPSGVIEFSIPPGFKEDCYQWLGYDNTCRLLREVCPSCTHHPECSLSKSARRAMGENYPIFPAEWLIVSQDFNIEFSDRSTYILCHRYDDGQQELFPDLFQKANYLPQAEKSYYVMAFDGLGDVEWDTHTLENID